MTTKKAGISLQQHGHDQKISENKCVRNSNIDDALHPHRQRIANTLEKCKSNIFH